MNINLELEEIILLLNGNKFVQAHDIFEELWRKYKNNESTRQESFILKAFVNGSVSIELYKMQRFEHSLNVWNTYKKYEYLIDEIISLNKNNYKKIKEIIYEKREKYII
jgi:predicted metal-dependent hydrolase